MIQIITFLLTFNAFALTIIVDPGHGGEDLGAKTSYWTADNKMTAFFEKELTLAIGKKLFDELKKQGHSVYLTRTHDKSVTLEKRAEMADKVGADIFLSIHANSHDAKHSHGVETYYLDNHKDKAVQRIEKLENVSLEGEDKIINDIIIDLVVDKTAPLSKKLASKIHYQLKKQVMKKHRLRDRGIKPGLFYVLALSKRPAVLLEVGFLSNPKERNLITTDAFQHEYVKAIARGVSEFAGPKAAKDNTPLF